MEEAGWFFQYVIEGVKYLIVGHWLFGFAWASKKSSFWPILYLTMVPIIIYLDLKEQFWLYIYVWIVVLVFCCFQAPTLELLKAIPLMYSFVCLTDMAISCIYMLGSGMSYNADKFLGIHMSDVFGIVVWIFIATKGKRLHEKFQDHWSILSLPVYLFLLMLLMLLGLVFGMFTIYSEFSMNQKMQRIIYGAGLLLLMIVLGGAFWLVHMRQEKIRLEEKEKYIQSFFKLQTKAYQETIEKYGRMRQFRHDISKHIFLLSEMSRSDRYEEMKAYLSTLQKDYNQILEIHTGNFLVDCLVNQTVNHLKEQGELLIQTKGHFPEYLDIEDTDLCILLGNALDNAREAILKCMEQRYIFFSIRQYKKNLYIVIQNSLADSRVSVTDTSKIDKTEHGYGVKNMCYVVEKYQGDIRWEIVQKKISKFQESIMVMELKIRLLMG